MQANGKNGSHFEAASVPLWREAFVAFDWLALRTSPVYYGLSVPEGKGEPVIVVPGFLAADLDALELYGWLRRIGYRPYFSGVGRNAECPDVLTQRLFETINRAYAETGLRVSIVGHSLGGTIARSAAVRMPGRVKQVIALASPRSHIRAHPTILAAAQLVRGQILRDAAGSVSPDCYTQDCACAFATSLRDVRSDTPRVTSIYTRSDGIVDWRSCTEDEDDANHEVEGTHLGLFVNPAVYRLVAELLVGEPA
jgi:pimeloyl-ACP methyl ester carboxylesterase